MIQRLQQLADASFEEARVLLDLNEWDMDAAVAEQEAWNEEETKLRGGVAKPKAPATTLQEFLYIQASGARCSLGGGSGAGGGRGPPCIFPFFPK